MNKPHTSAIPSRTIVQSHKLDLDSPGRRDYWVAFAHDSLWGDHLMPLTVMVGPQMETGRGLVAFGSNHGNEYEGPIAIKHLLSEVRESDVLGRIILVPVLNPGAFAQAARESVSDDGVNLNRAFIEGAGKAPAISGITHRLAAFVRDHLWPRVHVVLDLHAGGDAARFARCTSYHPIEDPEQAGLVEDTARWFGTPLIVTYQNSTPGLLTSEAERLGKVTVGCELGWGRSISAEGVRYGKQGVLAAAINHGQLRGSIAPIDHHRDGTQRLVSMVDRECFTVSPFSGHYESLVDCGQTVERGDVIGLLHDFVRIDDQPWAVRAEVSGVVIAQAFASPVARGQHIVVVGTTQDKRTS